MSVRLPPTAERLSLRAVAPTRSQSIVRSAPWAQTTTWLLPALVLSALTANPALTALAVVILAGLVLMLWRPGEPPVLLFACGFQWLQSCLKVLYADVLGEEVWRLRDVPKAIEEASAWSLGWCAALGTGMAIALYMRRSHISFVPTTSLPERFSDLLRIYLVWTALVFGAEPLVPDSLRQMMVAVAALRWAVLFALLAHALRTRENLGIAAAVFLGELAFGFLSFFSAFRFPLFVLALALPEGRLQLRMRHYAGATAVAAMAVFCAVVWSAIKIEYRGAMSAGKDTQLVVVSTEEQVDALVTLVSDLESADLDRGSQLLIDRIAYTDYFAHTLAFVPRFRAHEEGRIWTAALSHVLMPRAFFPDKAALESDSVRADRFTGLNIAHGDRGTSIALGTPAESYVDFGTPGLLFPALLFGLFVGLIYAWSLAGSVGLLDRGLGVALVLSMATVENGPAKMLGGTLSAFVVALMLRPLLRSWLLREAPLARTVAA